MHYSNEEKTNIYDSTLNKSITYIVMILIAVLYIYTRVI